MFRENRVAFTAVGTTRGQRVIIVVVVAFAFVVVIIVVVDVMTFSFFNKVDLLSYKSKPTDKRGQYD